MTSIFDLINNYITITVIKDITELQLHAITLENVIKLQLITITILNNSPAW